ncbi:MAG TPA: LysE family transporter [Paraburkholderia sp.]|jgi:threonine/homoserine/homoserine lactone efflux protein
MYEGYAANLLTLAALYSITCMSPGPDFVNVTSHALSARKSGIFAAAGVALGCSVWSTAAVVGLDFLALKQASFTHIIRVCGVLYLVYLGATLLLGAIRPKPAAIELRAISSSDWASLRRGFTTDMTNPTLVIFFGSLFATVLPVDAPLWVRFTSILIITFIAGAWHLAVAILFSARPARTIYRKLRRPIDAVLGSLLIVLAVRLAVR